MSTKAVLNRPSIKRLSETLSIKIAQSLELQETATLEDIRNKLEEFPAEDKVIFHASTTLVRILENCAVLPHEDFRELVVSALKDAMKVCQTANTTQFDVQKLYEDHFSELFIATAFEQAIIPARTKRKSTSDTLKKTE